MFKYPYTDLEAVNLDYIINRIISLEGIVDEFTALNHLEWMGEYNVAKEYKKWNLVSDGDNGYIAIKDAPAGTPLTNTSYWQPIANYTALYADVQTRLDALTHNVSNNSNVNMIIISDSYGVGEWDPSIGGGVEEDERFIPLLMDKLKVNSYYETAVNGAGFTAGTTFTQQLASLAVANPEAITDIFVVGGFNDKGSSYESILSAIGTFCVGAKARFVNARISIACVGWALNAADRNNISWHSLKAYSDCGMYGARYLGNTEYILHSYKLFCPDGYHPSVEGHQYLAAKLADAFMNGSCDCSNGFEVMTVTVDARFQSQNMQIYAGVNNSTALIGFDAVQLVPTSAITLTNSSVIRICRFTPNYLAGNQSENFNSIIVPVKIAHNGTLDTVNCRLWFGYDSTSKMCDLNLRPVMGVDQTISNVTALALVGCSWTTASLVS